MSDPTLADLQIFYTGGGANTTPSASIGGAISSGRIYSQSCTAFGPLSGVTIVDGLGNGVGVGTMTYTASTKKLTWQPYGGSVGAAVDVSVSGLYFIQGANNGGGLAVSVVAANLPTSNVTDTSTISNQTEKFFVNTTKAESDAGFSKYHCFAIKNAHATEPMVNIALWISENTPGADTWSLALDPLAASNGAVGPTAVANETTSPGLTFVTPVTRTDADVLNVGTLTAGQVRFFWIKNLTPSGITEEQLANTFKLGVYARG